MKPEDEKLSLVFVPIRHNFEKGDLVIDLTAKRNGWPEDEGVIIEVGGSYIKVRYPSGQERWKEHINLKKK